jgi:hypothetical protein
MKVIIKGFKDQKQAEAFIEWFEGQGEQDCSFWFEEAGVESPSVNCKKTYPIKRVDDAFIMVLNNEEK